jgi:hypothetical protein
MEKRDLKQKMDNKEREQQIKRMEADVIMRAALENEKRDRLLENEKRDREADNKEAQAQHQIDQLKWEARFSQMEQQQAARAYNIQPLSHPLQYFSTLQAQCFRLHYIEKASLNFSLPNCKKEDCGSKKYAHHIQ